MEDEDARTTALPKKPLILGVETGQHSVWLDGGGVTL
jgi:hypothetical protein